MTESNSTQIISTPKIKSLTLEQPSGSGRIKFEYKSGKVVTTVYNENDPDKILQKTETDDPQDKIISAAKDQWPKVGEEQQKKLFADLLGPKGHEELSTYITGLKEKADKPPAPAQPAATDAKPALPSNDQMKMRAELLKMGVSRDAMMRVSDEKTIRTIHDEVKKTYATKDGKIPKESAAKAEEYVMGQIKDSPHQKYDDIEHIGNLLGHKVTGMGDTSRFFTQMSVLSAATVHTFRTELDAAAKKGKLTPETTADAIKAAVKTGENEAKAGTSFDHLAPGKTEEHLASALSPERQTPAASHASGATTTASDSGGQAKPAGKTNGGVAPIPTASGQHNEPPKVWDGRATGTIKAGGHNYDWNSDPTNGTTFKGVGNEDALVKKTRNRHAADGVAASLNRAQLKAMNIEPTNLLPNAENPELNAMAQSRVPGTASLDVQREAVQRLQQTHNLASTTPPAAGQRPDYICRDLRNGAKYCIPTESAVFVAPPSPSGVKYGWGTPYGYVPGYYGGPPGFYGGVGVRAGGHVSAGLSGGSIAGRPLFGHH